MNLFLRALGFEKYDTDAERNLIENILDQNLQQNKDVRNAVFSRGCMIQMLSESLGLYLYGRYENGEFRYEYYFPFVVAEQTTPKQELTIERHLAKESYSVVCEEIKSGVTLIFYLENVLDYYQFMQGQKDFKAERFRLDRKNAVANVPIRGKKISLSALSVAGVILMPTEKKEATVHQKQMERRRKKLIEQAKNGDEDAIEQLTNEDMDTYTQLSRRVRSEDVLTIVESTFMPCGVECDQYSVMGEILSLRVEKNVLTEEQVYIMNLECNGLQFTLAIARSCLLGEPAVGRRFKGQIWLQGFVWFDR